MDAVVAGDLGVEGGGQQRPLPDRDDPAGRRAGLDAGEDLNLGSHSLDPRRPDEDGAQRLGAEFADVEVLLERMDLAAECVAAHRDIQPTQGLLVESAALDPVGEHDHACARAVCRHPRAQPLAQRLVQPEGAHQLVDDRGLAAGDDQGVDDVDLGGSAHSDGRGTAGFQGVQVLPDIPLDGQDTDGRVSHRRGRRPRRGPARPYPQLRCRHRTRSVRHRRRSSGWSGWP